MTINFNFQNFYRGKIAFKKIKEPVTKVQCDRSIGSFVKIFQIHRRSLDKIFKLNFQLGDTGFLHFKSYAARAWT